MSYRDNNLSVGYEVAWTKTIVILFAGSGRVPCMNGIGFLQELQVLPSYRSFLFLLRRKIMTIPKAGSTSTAGNEALVVTG